MGICLSRHHMLGDASTQILLHKGVKQAFKEQVGVEGREGCFNAVRNSQVLLLLSSSRGCPPNSLTNHSCHF